MEYSLNALNQWIVCAEQQFKTQFAELNALDAAIGDGDHGSNLARGFAKVVEKLQAEKPATPAALLKLVGMTLISSVGGASGPLYGTFFLEAAKTAGDQLQLDDAGLALCLQAGLAGIQRLGKAEPGDKTMVDALSPAVSALNHQAGLEMAAQKAREGRDATTPMIARKGRASYLGERAIGHADPGATSASLLFDCLAKL
ncbi:dihydroxyacetone kinase subunit L [Acidithiobacillus thiooxidans]|uniref:Dihydroxyacetone kinase subunit L n=1 Tax=Acidithiobacillus thiooxidans TaxID=930 RepID=A0A1C2HZ46_ACITH|nr:MULTISPECIES: dihydroxyacetone kinase subunit DhaL [Acidithiobacillus]MBE7567426.1 dihydroxyacetone kinase subunit L [Acidithiobacillus sp. HP-11]MBU2752989.1 dihydroxyacetone kinase subunit L [Acidithiobacillus thiooxidans]MBU2793028.1 dihydroxyacetone kinase subunit L [Acidithiobacillus thiooxidans]OCX69009.1 dihydroxyacetone kinase subunit L [Acidithiobacillus thiooxidans]OCX72847.1 dihydroxyacetone kinase subunit L [Acidithiobacillus thiooxidans]